MKACPIPDHAELEFARQVRTGRVHILPYRKPESWEDDRAPVMLASPFPVNIDDDKVLDAFFGLVTALCGYEGYTAPGGRLQRTSRDHFEDEALCISCVRALGDGSNRAFE